MFGATLCGSVISQNIISSLYRACSCCTTVDIPIDYPNTVELHGAGMTTPSAANMRANTATFLTAIDGLRFESSATTDNSSKNPASSVEFGRASTAEAAGQLRTAILDSTWSNSRADSLFRESRRGCDVWSAGVDLNGFQPLPGAMELSRVTEKVRCFPQIFLEILRKYGMSQ